MTVGYLKIGENQYTLKSCERPEVCFNEIEVFDPNRNKGFAVGNFWWEPLTLESDDQDIVDALLNNNGGDIEIYLDKEYLGLWKLSGCWVRADSDLDNNVIKLMFHEATAAITNTNKMGKQKEEFLSQYDRAMKIIK